VATVSGGFAGASPPVFFSPEKENRPSVEKRQGDNAVRYGLISDIHANREALEAALARLAGVEGYICLGDIVGYGPDPNACVARVRELPNLICVAGNHDLAAVGKYPASGFNPFARNAITWTAEQLSEESRAFLASLPLVISQPPFTLVHGALPDPMEYVLSQWEARQTLAEMDTPHGLIGHTHIAEYYVQADGQMLVEKQSLVSGGEIPIWEGRRYLINCGSVGQPRDGNPQGACGLLEEAPARLTVYRFDYEMEQTQQKILAAGLPDYLSQRLAAGR
jgi:predicted phosphodiesterase